MRRPLFIKGHLSFTLERHQLEFIHQNISVYGVTGLQWAPLSPMHHFGKEVTVHIRIPQQYVEPMQVQAILLRERTTRSDHMVVKFLLTDGQRDALTALINQYGFIPAKVTRKYPRIPVDESVASFPLKVYGRLSSHMVAADKAQSYDFEVRDLSPEGILLSTVDSRAAQLRPADRLDLVIEPRGDFKKSMLAQGKVCRITEKVIPGEKNLERYFGVQFMSIDPGSRDTFLSVLKNILEKIRVHAKA